MDAIWSGYSLFDPGYSDRRSFGYNIDVGNGFTTLIPAVLFAFGMTFELMPARVLGIIGLIIFWQMFYGTAVYFFQFFNNGRHKGHSRETCCCSSGSATHVVRLPDLGALREHPDDPRRLVRRLPLERRRVPLSASSSASD